MSTFQHKLNSANLFSSSWDISRRSFYSYWWPDISVICCCFCTSHIYVDSPHLGLYSTTWFVKIYLLVVEIQAEWSLWHQSALTSISDFFLPSEIVTMWQTDRTAHKLKPRSFHKSTHFWVHLAYFHLQCELYLTIKRIYNWWLLAKENKENVIQDKEVFL